jgi:hypothetical protein
VITATFRLNDGGDVTYRQARLQCLPGAGAPVRIDRERWEVMSVVHEFWSDGGDRSVIALHNPIVSLNRQP